MSQGPNSYQSPKVASASGTPGTGALWLSIFGFIGGIPAIFGVLGGFKARASAKRQGKSQSKANWAVGLGAFWLVSLLVGVTLANVGQESSVTSSIAESASEVGTDSEESKAQDQATESGGVAYQDVIGDALTNDEICASYATSLEEFQGIIDRRAPRLQGRDEDAFKADAFVKKNAWVRRDLADRYDFVWNEQAQASLDSLSDGNTGDVSNLDEYLTASLSACEFYDKYLEQRADVRNLNREQQAVVAAAERKPWYPKSYRAYSPNVAYKFTDGSCSISSAYCWTMRVISNTGCPNGLYAELNVKNGDTVVGFTNDLLASLAPNQKGELEFTYFSNSRPTAASLSEINCY